MTMCKDAVRASYCLKETAPGVGSNGKKTTVIQDSGQHRTRLTWAFGHSIKWKRVVWFVGTEMRFFSLILRQAKKPIDGKSTLTFGISQDQTTGCLVQHDWKAALTCLGFAALLGHSSTASENPRQLCQGSKSSHFWFEAGFHSPRRTSKHYYCIAINGTGSNLYPLLHCM